MKRVSPRMTERARALRREATPEERMIWARLRHYEPAFTRQLSISDAYIADLACRKARLVVELDGSQHVDSTYDAERTEHLHGLGWDVLRFWNSDVHANADGVALAILNRVAALLGESPVARPSRAGRTRKPRLR